jgi:hypothetical protein
MRTRNIALLIPVLVLATGLTGQTAEIPRMINYQGIVTDSAGVPLNELGASFEFGIYDQSVLGNMLWQEGPVVMDITDGLLSHPLGSIVPLPDSLFTHYGEIWIELTVNAEALPRAQLMANGYAFRVSTVDSASGGSITGEVEVKGASPGYQLIVYNELGGGGAGSFQSFNAGSSSPALRASTNSTGPAALLLHDLGGDAVEAVGDLVVSDLAFNNKVRLTPNFGLTSGGALLMLSNDGDTTLSATGDYFGGGRVLIGDTLGATAIEMWGNQGHVTISDPRPTGTGSISLLGKDTFSDGAIMTMTNGVGNATVFLDADQFDEGAASLKLMSGNELRVEIDAFDAGGGTGGPGGGGRIRLYDEANNPTVILDSDDAGDGRVITEVLEITGGADLSEQFDIEPGSVSEIKPGMVLSIDPLRIGHLRVSETEYDPTVAGIVSGAGGVKTGMLMGQSGSVADGKFAVALTGRVWCQVDASYDSVTPGDLLTTSGTPGHAMKATASGRMQGAIIGKAMSSLESGTGLVLVLVSLQ